MENFYTTLEEAKVEIWRRWNDKELRKKVEEFLSGDDILKVFASKPKAVLCRDIISPDLECLRFIDSAKEIGLDPLMLEYPEDKFVNKNSDKYYLCKLSFYKGKNKNGDNITSTYRIVDFNKAEGKKFCDINTVWGDSLVGFHHHLLEKSVPGLGDEIVDITKWFNTTRYESEYYYLYFLALFLCHGVLFENFLTNKEELEFTQKKVLPSFHKLEEMFGVRPLIVPVVPLEEETDQYWWCFPEKNEILVDSLIKGIQK